MVKQCLMLSPLHCQPRAACNRKASILIRPNAYALVRPDLRIHVGSNRRRVFNRPLKHDDVVIVPELFGEEDDWSLYYNLVEEMQEIQKKGTKDSEWISWHDGAHSISKNPTDSKTFNMVIDRMREYFNIKNTLAPDLTGTAILAIGSPFIMTGM